jgi:hypothetical protein
VPSAKSNYAVAVRCPFSSTTNTNELQAVIEANASDFAAPTFNCPPATVVATNVSYDLTAISSAQQAAIAIGSDISSYSPGASSSANVQNVVPGIQDVGVAAYGGTPSTPYGVQIQRNINVTGAPLLIPPMTTNDATSSETVTVNGVPAGYTSFVTALYVTAGGVTIPINGNSVPSYGVIASGDTATGDYYSVLGSAINSSSNNLVEALQSFTAPQNLTLVLPSPISFGGPNPATYPIFNASYSGFTGSGKTGWVASVAWVNAPTGTRAIVVYATSAFLGSNSVAIPDLSSLSTFFPGPPSKTSVGWSLSALQQSEYYFVFKVISPANETAQYAITEGSFLVP